MSSINPLQPLRPGGDVGGAARSAEGGAKSDREFAGMLREQLGKVSQMQAEADQGVQSFLTGQSANLTEVFSSARKAQVAFTLLMEIRNKLVDAYNELKQLRV